MRKAIALILFTLFSLGTFGVTIEQHLCCHSTKSQNNAAPNHCNDDESCCDDNDDCCDEIVSQVKIAKDFTAQNLKISKDFNDFAILVSPFFYANYVACIAQNHSMYSAVCYFPPPEDFQVLYSSFLI